MSNRELKARKPSAEARAEAAAWVARLHGPNRTPEVDAGLRRWLADDPLHAAAFELLTETWEKSGRLRRRPIEQVVRWERIGFRISFTHAVAATIAIITLAVIGTVTYLRNDALSTGVGELRIVTLDDGTRVHLNTDTRLRVRYDKAFRRVSLEHGEALFEVAKRPQWPFVVSAGARQVRALGTAFVVRRDEHNVAVTLVEGKVTVAPVAGDSASGSAQGTDATDPSQSARALLGTATFVLSPGERLTFAAAGSPKFDRPSLERVTAWERGQVSFDNSTLADAASEMNRYSRQQIVIDGPDIGAIRISGIFVAGDSINFAQAVARTYHLRVHDESSLNVVLMAADTAASTAH